MTPISVQPIKIKTITSSMNVPAHNHNITVVDPTSLQDTINDLQRLMQEPQEAVRTAVSVGQPAIVFVIVGGQSVPLPFYKGDDIEKLITQLRLILT